MTSDVSLNTAVQQQANTRNSSASLASDFSQFLNLLTTQLQNQDPLSPMDTSEFTNQLVLFSGVEQQINANQKLDSLVALGLTNSFTSALGYVGLDVSYVSSDMYFDGARPVDINYALNGQAVKSTISILDEEGEEVFSTEGALTGKDSFTWDGTLDGGGKAEPGTYQVRINALDIDNKPVTATTVVTGRVDGVETQNGAIFLLVGDRAVSVSNVLNANTPPKETVEPPAEDPAEDPAEEEV